MNGNAVAIIDPHSNRVTGQVAVGAAPAALALGNGSLWVANTVDQTVSRIDLAGSNRRFAGDGAGDLRRSGSELSAGLSESLFLGGRGGYLRVAATGGRQQAGAVFANRFVEVTAEAGAPLPARWTLYLDVDRHQQRFDNPQSNLTQATGPARDDVSWRGSLAAVRMLTDRLALTARASYVRRDSNVELFGLRPAFDYRRTVAGLGINWFF